MNEIADKINVFDASYRYMGKQQHNMYHLHEVDLFAARDQQDARTYFVSSGLKSLLSAVLEVFGKKEINSVLLEFSKITSSPQVNRLDFGVLWENPDEYPILDRTKINQNLIPLYQNIFEHGVSLFRQEEFFASPQFPLAYRTFYKSINEKIDQKLSVNSNRSRYLNKRRKLAEISLNHTNELGFESIDHKKESPSTWVTKTPFYSNQSYEDFWENDIPDPKEEGRGLWIHHALIHELFNKFFLRADQQNANTLLLSIPIIGAPANKARNKSSLGGPRFMGQGAIFIYLSFISNRIDEADLKDKILKLIGLEVNLIKDITYNYMLEVGLELAKEAEAHTERAYLESLLSATAAIVSRNGSHNLGSHILSSVLGGFQVLPDTHMLLRYIQERFDFIASITTSFPVWTYPVAFIGDLMHRFFQQRLLINNIARAENLQAFEFQRRLTDRGEKIKIFTGEENDKRKDRLIIKLRTQKHYWRKGDVEPNERQRHTSKTYIISPLNEEASISHDVLVAIPGGIVGYHAFYIILENIIRNSAKYGWTKRDREQEKWESEDLYKRRKNQKNLEITISFAEIYYEEVPTSYIEVRVWDNISTTKETGGLVDEINRRLSNSYLTKDGKLYRKNLGLAEMKIAAGVLNRKGLKIIGGYHKEDAPEEKKILYSRKNGKDHIGFISAYPHPVHLDHAINLEERYNKENYQKDRTNVKPSGFHLGYQFSIPRPSDVVIEGVISPQDKEKFEICSNASKVSIRFFEEAMPKDQSYDSDFVIILAEQNVEDETHPLVKGLLEILMSQRNNLLETRICKVLDLLDQFPSRVFLVSDFLYTNRIVIPEIIRRRIVLKERADLKHIWKPDAFFKSLYFAWIKNLRRYKEGYLSMPINLHIDLKGRESLPLERLNSLIFELFRDRISLNIESENIRDILQNVDIQEIYAMNEGRKDIEYDEFVKSWTMCANKKLKGEKEKFDLAALSSEWNKYQNVVRDIFTKYGESIETLPRIYLADTSNLHPRQEKSIRGLCDKFNSDINEYIKGSKQPKRITYVRHEKIERSYLCRSVKRRANFLFQPHEYRSAQSRLAPN